MFVAFVGSRRERDESEPFPVDCCTLAGDIAVGSTHKNLLPAYLAHCLNVEHSY